jgi:hypothetical protein
MADLPKHDERWTVGTHHALAVLPPAFHLSYESEYLAFRDPDTSKGHRTLVISVADFQSAALERHRETEAETESFLAALRKASLGTGAVGVSVSVQGFEPDGTPVIPVDRKAAN